MVAKAAVVRRARELWGTVRVRTTVAAAAILGTALVLAGIAMVLLLQRSLTNDVRTSALLRARAVADTLEAGESAGSVAVGDDEEEFVQVVDAAGNVVASSANLAGARPVPALGEDESVHLEVPFEDDPFLAVATDASTSEGPVSVIAGRTLETVAESTGAVVSLLGVGLPLVLVVVVAVTWRVVGRALAPVEAIRNEVEAISTRDLHRRVPNPTGSDEIARLARTMNEMLARLQRGQLRERRFVSDASHELRSPVASIRQHSEVALAHPDSTDVKELAEVVLAEGSRLQRLVEDLLLLARSDEGTLSDRTETIDLDDVLFAEAERLRASRGPIVDTTGVSGGRVSGDKVQLEKLVRNLTENAARHARERVVLSLRETEDEVVLTVDDDGEGVPPEERQRIFERFVRLDDARDRDSGGSGLGLAIVAEVAARHGGRVVATDAPGGGARFEVRLPRRA